MTQESQGFPAGLEPRDYLAHQDQWDHQETEVSLERMVPWDREARPGHRELLVLQEPQGQVESQGNLETMADQANLG